MGHSIARCAVIPNVPNIPGWRHRCGCADRRRNGSGNRPHPLTAAFPIGWFNIYRHSVRWFDIYRHSVRWFDIHRHSVRWFDIYRHSVRWFDIHRHSVRRFDIHRHSGASRNLAALLDSGLRRSDGLSAKPPKNETLPPWHEPTAASRIADMIRYAQEAVATRGNAGFAGVPAHRKLQPAIFCLAAVAGAAAGKCAPATRRQYPGLSPGARSGGRAPIR